MPGLVEAPPQIPAKRILQDAPRSRYNAQSSSPNKKRRLDINGKQHGNKANGHAGSSQPKSQFEEEVLEKLTQDMSGLKKKNSEKDQQWARPDLTDFDSRSSNVCFQSIEVEEGTLHGGKTTIKMFGVTEVCSI